MPELLARAPYQGEGNFSLSIRRSTAIGIAVSLAVHLFALFFIVPKLIKPDQELSEPPAPGPITARIQLPSRAAPPSEPAPAQPAITPTPPSAEPPREAPRRRPTPQRPTTPPIITRRGPAAPSLPAPPVPERPLPTPFPQPPADSNPETDMTANMEQRRRQRESQEQDASGNRRQSENEIATARIKENLKPNRGAGGVFRVSSMGIRSANIYFRGWRGDRNRIVEESFEIDAGLGGDVERAVVLKIIEMIRRDYTTDFSWESFRLGREIKLSARPEDTEALVRFLRLEFREVFASAARR